MYRGPGVWQKAILDAVAGGGAVVLTRDGESRSVQNAIRRAAKALEGNGRIAVASVYAAGVPRLAAFLPDGRAPASRIVMGLDGKEYRAPVSGRMERRSGE